MNQADLKALQTPLLVLAIVILLAASSIYGTELLRQQAERQLAAQQGKMRNAQLRLQQSGHEKQVIETFLPEYRELEREGFIGEERRINWLDSLRVANQRADLFGVDYQINAQRAYPFASELNPGQIQINESIMKLRFRLLHEGDLMRFLNLLAQTGTGVFAVNECALQRIDTGTAMRVEPHVAAECELAWLTARPPGVGRKRP